MNQHLAGLYAGQCDCAVPLARQCDCAVPCHAPHTLSAWLHLTDRCNLRCDYCYLPHLPHDLTIETGRDILRATLRSAHIHGYQQVQLKYGGGEPLLAFPLVVGLHRYAQRLAARYGLALEGILLSNGTLLTPVMVETLQSLGLRLVISLDNLEELSAHQRIDRCGRDSAADAMRAIELACAQGLVPAISITVSGRSIAHLPALMEWVLERDLPFGLNFYRAHHRSARHADLHLEPERIISGMLAAYRVIEARLPRRSLLAALVDHTNLASPHHYPCSVGQSYLVFDTQGQVAKCQMHQEHIIATAQTADPLALVRADTQGIQNLPVDAKEQCRSCKWRSWCAGGCPLVTYRATGRYDLPSPNCAIYQALYPEVVRLERLRLLTYTAL